MASTGTTSRKPAAKGRVLIVDDEAGMRDLLKTVLEGDYQVSEAESGAALHHALNHEQPDVVLLDMMLPDANGLGLLPAIKERWPATEVIVLTGHPNDRGAASWATQAVGLGAFSLMTKSAGLDFQKLLDGISLAVARCQQTQSGSGLRLRG
jgi:DNA-binding NtrC family response regulator